MAQYTRSNMAKFYFYGNASRRLRTQKHVFSFDVVDQFAGSWRGILKLEDENQIAALDAVAASVGVKEISEEEYNGWLKKKLNSSKPSPASPPRPRATSTIAGPAAPVVVKDPFAQTTPKVAVEPTATKPTVAEAVTIGEAPFVDPLEQRSDSKRRKKKAS